MTVAPAHPEIIFGTRASRLAQWQTSHVTELIHARHPNVTCRSHAIETTGDRVIDQPLPEIGGKGVFTLELEQALRAANIDAAVHSLKDLPTEPSTGLVIGAVCSREDARDVLISSEFASFAELPAKARVGTSSVRRAAQLRHLRSDLQFAPVRGNVETRIRQCHSGQYDAIVLAAAGVVRLGLDSDIRQFFTFEEVLPAPGQGALAVQCRFDDTAIRSVLASINEKASQCTTAAERSFLADLAGGCSTPVAAYATLTDGDLHLHGRVSRPDGRHQVDVLVRGRSEEAMELGKKAARKARARGADALLR